MLIWLMLLGPGLQPQERSVFSQVFIGN